MRVAPGAGVPTLKARRRQRGLGLLEVLLFIAIVGGLALVGYLEWRERSALQSSRQERASLSQADTAVITFATVMQRLPCPDTDRDGLEDCAAGAQKGWLPSVSLKLAGADAGVGVRHHRVVVAPGLGHAARRLESAQHERRHPFFQHQRARFRGAAGALRANQQLPVHLAELERDVPLGARRRHALGDDRGEGVKIVKRGFDPVDDLDFAGRARAGAFYR